jgi:hypothetical protein
MPSSTSWSPNDLRNPLARIAGWALVVVMDTSLGHGGPAATSSPSMPATGFTPVSGMFQGLSRSSGVGDASSPCRVRSLGRDGGRVKGPELPCLLAAAALGLAMEAQRRSLDATVAVVG